MKNWIEKTLENNAFIKTQNFKERYMYKKVLRIHVLLIIWLERNCIWLYWFLTFWIFEICEDCPLSYYVLLLLDTPCCHQLCLIECHLQLNSTGNRILRKIQTKNNVTWSVNDRWWNSSFLNTLVMFFRFCFYCNLLLCKVVMFKNGCYIL